MAHHPFPERTFPCRLAFGILFLFLLAVVLALGVTVWSAPAPAKLVAGLVVVPVVAVTLFLLYLEHRARPLAYLGASVLGVFGVATRIVVSTQPVLEVGGGLPFAVDVAYIALGLAVGGASLWAYVSSRAATHEDSEAVDR